MLVHVWDTPLVSCFIDTLWATVYPGGGACVRKLKVTALPLIVHFRLLPKRLNISSEKTSPYQQLQRFFFFICLCGISTNHSTNVYFVALEIITYLKEHINLNLGFVLQLKLLSELQFWKINQHLLTNLSQEFNHAVV